MRKLKGRVAILTDASPGLGVEVAPSLASQGVNLVLAARSVPELEVVASEIRDLGVQVLVVPCDVTSESDRIRLVEATIAEFGRCDILVNNAGIESTAFYEQQPAEGIAQLIQVNLVSAMLLTHAVLPHMLERKRGHIVNMASLAGKVPVPYSVPYSTSKAGMIAFTEGIRNEYKGRGVSASVICPGFVSEAGMYADWEKETGRRASFLAKPVTPQRVAANVITAIKRDRRPGLALLILQSRPYFDNLRLGYSRDVWERATTRLLKSKNYIVMTREKPTKKEPEAESFFDQIAKADIVVSLNSAATIKALRYGIPAYCTLDCTMSPHAPARLPDAGRAAPPSIIEVRDMLYKLARYELTKDQFANGMAADIILSVKPELRRGYWHGTQ